MLRRVRNISTVEDKLHKRHCLEWDSIGIQLRPLDDAAYVSLPSAPLHGVKWLNGKRVWLVFRWSCNWIPAGSWILQSSNGITKHLLAFVSLYRATPRVTQHLLGVFERLLDYYSHFWISTIDPTITAELERGCQMYTSLWQSQWNSNGGCQTCTSLRQSLRSSNGVRERHNELRDFTTKVMTEVCHDVCLEPTL